MLYLAIDQHSKQITVCVRDAEGETMLSRQVSTRPEKIKASFQKFVEMDAEFMAILEVCGFNDWLIAELQRWNCREIVGQRRTRALNKIHRILNRHNLLWDYPTKTFQTQRG